MIQNVWNGVIAVVVFALVMAIGVLTRPILPVDETRYMAVAWEMYQHGSYLLLHKNGDLYVDKPPLLFWLINLVWSLTGVSAALARMVGPAFAVACVFFAGPLARRLWPETPGVDARARWILAGFAVFATFGGLTQFDAMMAFATMLGIWSLHHALNRHRRVGWLGFGVAIAFGVYSKGPVILVHLLPAALLYRLWLPRTLRLSVRFVAGGVAIALFVALLLVSLWLVPALIAGGPEYSKATLWTQSAGRMTSSFAHYRPFWFYFAVLPAILFPWFWVPAVWAALRRMPWRDDPGLRLCLVWPAAALAIFCFVSGKQVHYLLPELPAMAMLLARVLPAELGRADWKFATVPLLLAGAVALIVPLGFIDLGKLDALLMPHAVIAAAGLVLLGLALVCSRMPFVPGIAGIGLGLILVANLIVALSDLGEIYDTTAIAESLSRYDGQGIVFFAQNYHAEFNFTGRLVNPVTELQAVTELNAWASEHPGGAVIARLDRPHPDWQQKQEFLFRNTTYAIWSVADQTKSKTTQ